MSASRAVTLGRMLVREFSKTAPKYEEEVPARIRRLRENQKKFQVDDGTPVYLKGGAGDRILFGITLAVIGVGLGMTLETYYQLTFKEN